jgi:hypothetical protein
LRRFDLKGSKFSEDEILDIIAEMYKSDYDINTMLNNETGMNPQVKLVQVLIPKSILERVTEETARTGNSRSTLVRLALLEYLQKSEGRP